MACAHFWALLSVLSPAIAHRASAVQLAKHPGGAVDDSLFAQIGSDSRGVADVNAPHASATTSTEQLTASADVTIATDCLETSQVSKRRAKELHFALTKLQTPANCACARQVEFVAPDTDDLPRVIHWFGFMLGNGLLSERTLTLANVGAGCPANASKLDLFCIFETALAPCAVRTKARSSPTCVGGDVKPSLSERMHGATFLDSDKLPMAHGNAARRKIHMRFDEIEWVSADGPERSWFRTGVVSQKYLALGSFWFRSHIQHWAWKLKPEIQNRVSHHMLTLSLKGKPYIGIYISHNMTETASVLALDLTAAVSLKRAMLFARRVRASDPRISTILLATDSVAVIRQAESLQDDLNKHGWQMYWNPGLHAEAKKQTGAAFTQMDAILAIEGLRNAEYLIGPMTSDLFRLGVELNFATKASMDTENIRCGAERYQSLDIPWYQGE